MSRQSSEELILLDCFPGIYKKQECSVCLCIKLMGWWPMIWRLPQVTVSSDVYTIIAQSVVTVNGTHMYVGYKAQCRLTVINFFILK